MRESATGPLQREVYDQLSSSEELTDLVSGIFDFVEEDTAFPYVSIGEMTAIDWDTVNSDGQEHTITIHTWSQQRGNAEAKKIMDTIYGILHHAELSLDGHECVLIKFAFAEIMTDPDGVTRHGVQRFKVLTEGF